MNVSLTAIRQAARLVDEHQNEGWVTPGTRQLLVTQAVTNPMRVIEIVAALAAMVADARPPELPTDEVSYGKYLKRAHAAYTRGERHEWVVTGEREYQRLRKRRQRKEKGAA